MLQPSMTLDAEITTPVATARLVRFHVDGPADHVLGAQQEFWLDLCLTPRPRNARGCFSDRWASERFAPIGQVFIVPPREQLRTLSDGAPSQTSVLCHLRPEPLSQWFDGELSWTDTKLEAGLDIRAPNVRSLLQRLATELRDPGFASETIVELIVAQLAIELARYNAAVQTPSATGKLSPWRLRLIDERLREVRAAPTLAELGRLCNISIRQLARGFRASRGCSIGDFVAQCRIDNAKRLLVNGESVKATAYALGFASPSSFSFAFRTATGQTPREYRATASRARAAE
ncbi:MAG TPA: helix-turn-helix transcriptional regulator [Polyangiales bacterium]|nr:helix-turn-helix transcriptional regulator [Polyangiales bacterium]